MVLEDTSVWIRFLSNRASYAAALEGLLLRGEVCGHDFVLGELLIGDKSTRHQLLADYPLMWTADSRLAAVASELGIGYE